MEATPLTVDDNRASVLCTELDVQPRLVPAVRVGLIATRPCSRFQENAFLRLAQAGRAPSPAGGRSSRLAHHDRGGPVRLHVPDEVVCTPRSRWPRTLSRPRRNSCTPRSSWTRAPSDPTTRSAPSTPSAPGVSQTPSAPPALSGPSAPSAPSTPSVPSPGFGRRRR